MRNYRVHYIKHLWSRTRQSISIVWQTIYNDARVFLWSGRQLQSLPWLFVVTEHSLIQPGPWAVHHPWQSNWVYAALVLALLLLSSPPLQKRRPSCHAPFYSVVRSKHMPLLDKRYSASTRQHLHSWTVSTALLVRSSATLLHQLDGCHPGYLSKRHEFLSTSPGVIMKPSVTDLGNCIFPFR